MEDGVRGPTCPHCGTEVYIHHASHTYACQTPTCRAFHGEGMEHLSVFPTGAERIKELLSRPKSGEKGDWL